MTLSIGLALVAVLFSVVSLVLNVRNLIKAERVLRDIGADEQRRQGK